jgi:galactonate dehydratase
MKITSVKCFSITYGIRGMFMVKIETDTGLYGWGEGGISGREKAEEAMVESFRHLLIGQDPRRMDYLWQLMARGAFFEGGLVMGGALAGVDLALWDILGKHYNVPVWQLLGGQSRDCVECYCHCSVANAKQRVTEGWHYLRLSGGTRRENPRLLDPPQYARDLVNEVKAAREAVGPDVNLCIDFHTRLNPPTAAAACNAMAPYDPFFVEDPLRSLSASNYIAFRQRTSVPLAIGEACCNKWEFQELIEHDATDYARVDVANIGGLTEARKVAAMAETHYIDLLPHNATGPISNAAAIHLGVAVPNFMVLERNVSLELAPEIFQSSIRFKAPCFELPTEPGLGVDVDESKLTSHPWKPWELATLHRPDGGLNNW